MTSFYNLNSLIKQADDVSDKDVENITMFICDERNFYIGDSLTLKSKNKTLEINSSIWSNNFIDEKLSVNDNNCLYFKHIQRKISSENLVDSLYDLRDKVLCGFGSDKHSHHDVLMHMINKFSNPITDMGTHLIFEPIAIAGDRAVVFDLDGCLISNSNGSDPKMKNDQQHNYVFMYRVEEVIENYFRNGIQVIIVTNQLNPPPERIQKLVNIHDHFSRRIMFIVLHTRSYRKPDPTSMEYIKSRFKVDFYCGDAIGESDFVPFKWSNTDLMFARNSGVEFISPLNIFGTNFYDVSPTQQVIIMMGVPGSGKTSIARRLENPGAVRYSSDECSNNLKSIKRLDKMRANIYEGKKIIIDATNPSNEKRNFWINFAYENKVDYIILWCVRDGRCFNELRTEKKVPRQAYYRYVSDFERPLEKYIVVN